MPTCSGSTAAISAAESTAFVPLFRATPTTPVLYVSLGTVRVTELPLRSLRSSQLKKKKARSRIMRPPIEAPYWLRTSGVRATPARLLNQELEAVSVLRMYSYSEPWNWLEPLLVMRETWPPDERPWSAPCPATVVRNSWTESSGIGRTALKPDTPSLSLTSTPS